MKRFFTIVAGSCLLVLAAGSVVRADDEVTYYDRDTKKEAKVVGVIAAEDPGKISIKPNTGANKDIAAQDVIDVKYDVPVAIKLDYVSAINSEKLADTGKEEDRKTKLTEAMKKYKDLIPQVSKDLPKRHLEYKVARIMALQALADTTQAPAAIDQLTTFKKTYPDGWQIASASSLLAQLQLATGDTAGAQKTYEDLGKVPGLPPDVALDSQLKVVQMLINAKKIPEAKAKVDDLTRTAPANSPQAVRLQIAKLACTGAEGQVDQAVKGLNDIIAASKDRDVIANAYNTLGDVNQGANKLEEARWNYLWVDVIYHQNKDEHARALYNLYKVFKGLKDDTRAGQNREILTSDPKFAGSEYQRMVAMEK